MGLSRAPRNFLVGRRRCSKPAPPEEVADTIGRALAFVPKHRLLPCTNCGLAPMDREIALSKLEALGAGAAIARQRYGSAGA